MRQGLISVVAVWSILLAATAFGQEPSVLSPTEAARIVPAGFYFEGQSAPTQMRNSAVARLGKNRHVIAGLVDTSGYSSSIVEKYIGFLITDSPIVIGGKELGTGAYGFGFTADGKMNILDIGGKTILTVSANRDEALKRPRPLIMVKSPEGIRLYNGKTYVTVSM